MATQTHNRRWEKEAKGPGVVTHYLIEGTTRRPRRKARVEADLSGAVCWVYVPWRARDAVNIVPLKLSDALALAEHYLEPTAEDLPPEAA